MAKFKADELKKLFNRVYHDKMVVAMNDDGNITRSDEEDIKMFCKKVFGDGSETPDPSMLHQFNNLVVKLADEIADPMITDIIGLLANTQTEKRGNVVSFNLPRKTKAKFVWSANGSGVDLIRVAGKTKEVAVPRTFSTGFYYESDDLVQDSVKSFRELVDNLAEAKVKLYLKEINKLINAAITATKIPTANIKEGANLQLADYNKISSTISRVGGGGRPLFIADSLLVDHFANQQATTNGVKELLTDKYKDQLLRDLNISSIGRTNAFNLINPFTDEQNSKTDLPVNIGYMLASEGKLKPFGLVEYGGMRQTTSTDFETGRVMMKIFQDASLVLVFARALGYIKDSSITLG